MYRPVFFSLVFLLLQTVFAWSTPNIQHPWMTEMPLPPTAHFAPLSTDEVGDNRPLRADSNIQQRTHYRQLSEGLLEKLYEDILEALGTTTSLSSDTQQLLEKLSPETTQNLNVRILDTFPLFSAQRSFWEEMVNKVGLSRIAGQDIFLINQLYRFTQSIQKEGTSKYIVDAKTFIASDTETPLRNHMDITQELLSEKMSPLLGNEEAAKYALKARTQTENFWEQCTNNVLETFSLLPNRIKKLIAIFLDTPENIVASTVLSEDDALRSQNRDALGSSIVLNPEVDPDGALQNTLLLLEAIYMHWFFEKDQLRTLFQETLNNPFNSEISRNFYPFELMPTYLRSCCTLYRSLLKVINPEINDGNANSVPLQIDVGEFLIRLGRWKSVSPNPDPYAAIPPELWR